MYFYNRKWDNRFRDYTAKKGNKCHMNLLNQDKILYTAYKVNKCHMNLLNQDKILYTAYKVNKCHMTLLNQDKNTIHSL